MLALAGCGGGAAVNHAPADPCETRVPARSPSDTLTVVLFDTVDLSHTPWGRNREERFIFSHLYETLLTIDCHGEFQSGLAKTVLEASDGWLVTLRDDAHFWDQTDVTSQDVVESFKPAIAQGIAIKSVDPVDEHTLLLRGYNGRPDVKLLTLQMLSITKPSPTAGPPIGTGSWMLDESVPFAEAVVIRPVLAEVPVVRFVQGNVSDARDIMDGTADAMITDDPGAIEYARSREHTSLAPLVFDRAYFLTSIDRAVYVTHGVRVPNLPPSVCDALARDAVRADARGGSTLLVEAETSGCQSVSASDGFLEIVRPQPRLLFASDDPTARGLAERIVALSAMDTTASADARAIVHAIPVRRGMRAMGVAPEEFERVMFSGAEAAFLFSLSWCGDFPCVEQQIRRRAPWLLLGEAHLSHKVIPLVETRAHFIATGDRVGFVDDHTGDVRIMIPSEEKRR